METRGSRWRGVVCGGGVGAVCMSGDTGDTWPGPHARSFAPVPLCPGPWLDRLPAGPGLSGCPETALVPHTRSLGTDPETQAVRSVTTPIRVNFPEEASGVHLTKLRIVLEVSASP